VARWLAKQPQVERVIHPALEGDPGHAIWKRDFTGACGLFAVVLKPASKEAVAALVEGLELFGIGASWGGYESLAIPFELTGKMRTATRWQPGGPTLRFHIGLEDPDDLIEDIERGFNRFDAA
jgi:cystathionine beta-lyase